MPRSLIHYRRLSLYLQICCWLATLNFPPLVLGVDDFVAGPLFSRLELTLDSGVRTEALGPFFYKQQSESENILAVPPLLSFDLDPAVESEEDDFLYPVMTYRRYGTQYRWQFVQLFSFSGGESPKDLQENRRITLFPLYFQQRSPNPDDNYTAFFPFYGTIKGRLFRDEIFVVMFPLYSQTRRRDMVTDNYLYPIFDVHHGDGLKGWQVWPLVGNEHKDVTMRTNGFGDLEIIPGHDNFFALWPIHFSQDTGIGSENPSRYRADLPFYSLLRSPKRDSTSVLWPFFTWVDDRGQKYREWQMPYPIVVIARGPGKTTTRFWPFFNQAHNDELETDYYLWPLYRYDGIHADPLDYRRTRILIYLYVNMTEKNLATGTRRHRVGLWPLFTREEDFNGDRRLQILALLEPVLSGNTGLERNWSPLWSIWRAESSPKRGMTSQSLLWNLYRYDTAPASRKCSLLFGLFQYQSSPKGKSVRLFYLPIVKTKPVNHQ
jgi:hypothetical protein